MCGIAGFNWENPDLAKKMADTLEHRGPDQQGSFSNASVSLGHRRLSILDLSERGRQPMFYKKFGIIFNGEIYNYRDLREILKATGHHFNSNTDTEVILHAYEEWGKDCVKKFNGMWAFCLYDQAKNILFLSRDRFGEKPLYYYFQQNKFIFASELKAIKIHEVELTIDCNALNAFFYQKYIGGQLSIYRECKKVLPAECLVFDLARKKLESYRYYSLLDDIAEHKKIPLDKRLEMIEPIIVDAVEKRLMADVPVGSFLSGGLDSSLISAIIAKKHRNFKTFSIGFKDRSFNELPFSQKVADYIGTKHFTRYLSLADNLIKKVLSSADEPFGDSSIFTIYLLSRMTKENATVALSGDAGDEVFGGYDTYQAFVIAKILPPFIIKALGKIVRWLPPSERKVTRTLMLQRFTSSVDQDVAKRHLDWMATFRSSDRMKLLGENFRTDAEIGFGQPMPSTKNFLAVQLNDINEYLPGDILKKVDSASMLASLETRIPFLDSRLVALVLSLPDLYKVRLLHTKHWLRKIAAKYLPREIITRRKRGFTVPVSKWIKESPLVQEYLTKKEFYRHGYLAYDYVMDLYRAHRSNKQDNARPLWLIFTFNYWWKNIFKPGKKHQGEHV